MLLLSGFAADFGREDERLRTTRYARLRGDGPVYGRWRNSRGAYLATRFTDGQIEHVDVFDGKTLTETRSFAADGSLLASVDWATSRVTLQTEPPEVVSFDTWSELPLGGVVFRAPALVEVGGRWTGEGIAIAVQPLADPFSDDFTTALRAGCGCEIEARMTAWIAGRPAAHFRLQRPSETADVVALPTDAGLVVMTAAGPDLASLLPLRAMMATARETP